MIYALGHQLYVHVRKQLASQIYVGWAFTQMEFDYTHHHPLIYATPRTKSVIQLYDLQQAGLVQLHNVSFRKREWDNGDDVTIQSEDRPNGEEEKRMLFLVWRSFRRGISTIGA